MKILAADGIAKKGIELLQKDFEVDVKDKLPAEELLEIITWKQLGLYLKPIVILNTAGYYDALLAQLDRALSEQFMRPMHSQIWQVATTPEEAVRLCEETPLWDSNIRKFAAL